MRSPFVNLTPHALNVRCEDGSSLTIAPSGAVARVTVAREFLGALPSLLSESETDHADMPRQQVPVSRAQYGAIEGLPPRDPDGGIFYIVSGMVRAAVSADRDDVLCPGEAERDSSGKVIGCLGLSR